MKRLGIIVFILYGFTNIQAQEGRLPLEFFTTQAAELMLIDSAGPVHLEIKPYSYWTIERFARPTEDTNVAFARFPQHRNENFFFNARPMLDLSVYGQGGTFSGSGLQSIAGLSLGVGYKSRLYLTVDGILGYANPPLYLDLFSNNIGVYPGFGRITENAILGDGFSFAQSGFSLAVKAAPQLELFLGRGRNFIGEGYRSMFLSDFASNYNYLRSDLSVWKVKYMFLVSQMSHANGFPETINPISNKFAVSHYLSMNLTKKWSVGAFESVVWESEDSVVSRGLDINYLNPAIFFRPIEYGMGSSDNYLLGFSSTVRPTRGLTLYGQILLDEFLFRDWASPIFKAVTNDSAIRTGYWANKQAYQCGIKYLEPFNIDGLTLLAEVNVVRPFTFGHSNESQSYMHLNQPLAHPLGANFIEWVQVSSWQRKQFKVALFTTYARKGFSNNLGIMGEDPLVSNTLRNQNQREYGNFITQGKRADIANIRTVFGYTLVEEWNLRAEASLHYRLVRTSDFNDSMLFFGLGLKTALWNDERNF